MFGRRTKIVATLGPATDATGILDRLVAAGMDCARLNCSHGDADALLRRAREVRAAAERTRRPLGLLFDLQGPKLRLSGATAERTLEADETVTFAGGAEVGGADRVVVDFPGFARLCTDRSEIVIGDGVPRLAVARVGMAEVRARVLSPGRSCRRSPRRTSPTSRWPRRPERTSSRSRSSAPPPISSSCAPACASWTAAPA